MDAGNVYVLFSLVSGRTGVVLGGQQLAFDGPAICDHPANRESRCQILIFLAMIVE